MEKQIDLVDVQRRFDQVLAEIIQNENRYIVSDRGNPVAAIVPVTIYEQWKIGRDAFFAQMQNTAEWADLTEEEGEQLITEALAVVRASDMG